MINKRTINKYVLHFPQKHPTKVFISLPPGSDHVFWMYILITVIVVKGCIMITALCPIFVSHRSSVSWKKHLVPSMLRSRASSCLGAVVSMLTRVEDRQLSPPTQRNMILSLGGKEPLRCTVEGKTHTCSAGRVRLCF